MSQCLSDYLALRNGKTSPQRIDDGRYTIFGSNGPIGRSSTLNAEGPFIVVGRVGSYCGSLFFSTDDGWVTDNAIITTAFDPHQTRFWFYYLQTLGLNARSSGSGQPLLNQSTIGAIPASVPRINERIAIAEVLGALDDKIAANTKLAETSSQLSAQLFTQSIKASSVDFPLADITTLLSRGITPKYSDDDDTMLVLNQKCVRGQRVDLAPARRTELSKIRSDKVLQANDVLVNSTGQGTLGRVARWTGTETATVDSHITVLRFAIEKVDRVVAGFGILRLQDTITAMGEGSTGQTELSRTELGNLKVRLPARQTQVTLGRKLSTASAMEAAVLKENATLAATRDTLLPQLMSGKLRVKDAEALVASAVWVCHSTHPRTQGVCKVVCEISAS